jgi:hypothetical protein
LAGYQSALKRSSGKRQAASKNQIRTCSEILTGLNKELPLPSA